MELEEAKKVLSNMDIDFSGSAICKECIFKEEKILFFTWWKRLSNGSYKNSIKSIRKFNR